MSTFDTNFLFSRGKLAVALDGGAGSSGKGKLGSFICEHSDNWTFACNTFMPQAGHTVQLDGGRQFFYQTLNSCAYMPERYEKLYIGPGATIELKAFWKEVEANGVPHNKLGISPLTSILLNTDRDYEHGVCDIDGVPITNPIAGGPLVSSGSTRHGCGANRARRVLRHKQAKYARDMPELQEFLCDVPGEIMKRLDEGQAGLFEIAQGFQLSFLLPHMFPHTTSRNCSIAAGLDDLMVPPYYVGNLVLNFRTYPIRIHDKVYEDKATRTPLTWEQVTERAWAHGTKCDLTKELLDSVGIDMIDMASGPPYADQHELTIAELNARIGAEDVISELTSVTKLPRRFFTFSRQNLDEALRHNQINGDVYLALNFANYVDHALTGFRGTSLEDVPSASPLHDWLSQNMAGYEHKLKFIGTGASTDDMIQLT